MDTIIHAPLPTRNISSNEFYFAQKKDTRDTVVVYLSTTYKVFGEEGKIVLIFGQKGRSDEILWTTIEVFLNDYTVIGKVNRVTWE